MTEQKKALLLAAGITAFGLTCFAKTPVLTGKMVAYDPLLHASKPSTMQANREVVILETSGRKTKYVKIVFVSFGTKQVEEKFFDGTTPLTVQALRNHECDENSPRMVPQVSLEQKSGTYVLTDPFKTTPPHIKNLECYDATGKK
jgi:hypothetical protein